MIVIEMEPEEKTKGKCPGKAKKIHIKYGSARLFFSRQEWSKGWIIIIEFIQNFPDINQLAKAKDAVSFQVMGRVRILYSLSEIY